VVKEQETKVTYSNYAINLYFVCNCILQESYYVKTKEDTYQKVILQIFRCDYISKTLEYTERDGIEYKLSAVRLLTGGIKNSRSPEESVLLSWFGLLGFRFINQ